MNPNFSRIVFWGLVTLVGVAGCIKVAEMPTMAFVFATMASIGGILIGHIVTAYSDTDER